MRDDAWDKDNIPKYPFPMFVEYLNRKYDLFLKEKLKDYNVTPTDCSYLMHIHFRRDSSQKQLANLFYVSEANVAKILKKLERNGFIKRVVCEENKSQKIVKLTEKGYSAVLLIMDVSNEWQSLVFEDFDEDEIIQTKQTLYDLTFNASNIG